MFGFSNSGFVTRVDSLCGIAAGYKLPSCQEVTLALSSTSGSKFRDRIETFYHGNIHTLLGGIWDCDQDHLDDILTSHPNVSIAAARGWVPPESNGASLHPSICPAHPNAIPSDHPRPGRLSVVVECCWTEDLRHVRFQGEC